MKSYLITLLLIFVQSPLLAVYLPLEMNSRNNKIQDFMWNGTTPLALDLTNGASLEISLSFGEQTFPLIKTKSKNFENQDHFLFTLTNTTIPDNTTKMELLIKNNDKKWPFQNHKAKITKKIVSPKLFLISHSPKITHGGSGMIVVESEASQDLSFLAFLDERDIPFYPQTFQQDGIYAILFPWYTENSSKWSKNRILVIDNAGNTNMLSLSGIPTATKKYRQRTITLPPDYAQQKAKELTLSSEDAQKLEGNIKEINKALAQTRTFERWKKTRTTFHSNAQEIVTDPFIFSKPSLPMSNATATALYGDRRNYYYQKKRIRSSIHKGLDYASYKNTPIYALLDGTVIYSDWYSGNGKSVIIDHGFNTYSLYAHNSELLAKEGEFVKAGTQISISGTTGQSTGDHLHLSLFIQGMFIEPSEWTNSQSLDTLFHKPLKDAETYLQQKTRRLTSTE